MILEGILMRKNRKEEKRKENKRKEKKRKEKKRRIKQPCQRNILLLDIKVDRLERAEELSKTY
jgi:hypothetical protein